MLSENPSFFSRAKNWLKANWLLLLVFGVGAVGLGGLLVLFSNIIGPAIAVAAILTAVIVVIACLVAGLMLLGLKLYERCTQTTEVSDSQFIEKPQIGSVIKAEVNLESELQAAPKIILPTKQTNTFFSAPIIPLPMIRLSDGTEASEEKAQAIFAKLKAHQQTNDPEIEFQMLLNISEAPDQDTRDFYYRIHKTELTKFELGNIIDDETCRIVKCILKKILCDFEVQNPIESSHRAYPAPSF